MTPPGRAAQPGGDRAANTVDRKGEAARGDAGSTPATAATTTPVRPAPAPDRGATAPAPAGTVDDQGSARKVPAGRVGAGGLGTGPNGAGQRVATQGTTGRSFPGRAPAGRAPAGRGAAGRGAAGRDGVGSATRNRMAGPTAATAATGTVAPVSVRQLVHCGLVASVVFLLFFAALGAFGVLAFGALAALWSLGVAWVIIFGPPAVDGRMLREQFEDLRVSGARALRTHGGKARSSLRGTASAARANLPRRRRGQAATEKPEPTEKPDRTD